MNIRCLYSRILPWLLTTGIILKGVHGVCYYPGRLPHVLARADLSRSNGVVTVYPENTTFTYSCVPGYELFGDVSRTCQKDGTWSRSQPFCALKLIANTTSDHSNDAYYQTCELKDGIANFDFQFFEPQSIDFIMVAIKKGLPDDWDDITVALKNDNGIASTLVNRLKQRYILKVTGGQEYKQYTFHLIPPQMHQTFHIVIAHSANSSFDICDIAIYSKTAISPNQCTKQTKHRYRIHSMKCYEVSVTERKWSDAQEKCEEDAEDNSGSLARVNENNIDLIKFLLDMLQETSLTARHTFIHGESPHHKCSTLFYNFTNVYDDSCILLLPYVCQKDISGCGYPDQNEKSILRITEKSTDKGKIQIANYRCPSNYHLEGSRERECRNGVWSLKAPKCSDVHCKRPTNSTKTSFILSENSTAVGSCMETIMKSDNITREWHQCREEGHWDKVFNCTCSRVTAVKCTLDDDNFRIVLGCIIGFVTLVITTTWILVGITIYRNRRW